jgi:hypothetical protein
MVVVQRYNVNVMPLLDAPFLAGFIMASTRAYDAGPAPAARQAIEACCTITVSDKPADYEQRDLATMSWYSLVRGDRVAEEDNAIPGLRVHHLRSGTVFVVTSLSKAREKLRRVDAMLL